MPKAKQKQRPNSHYDAMKKASGWYLQAWRDFRRLTLQEVADEVGTSKSVVSELETGSGQRFNSDHLPLYAKALGTRAGWLIDHNPFVMDPQYTEYVDEVQGLDPRDMQTVRDLVRRLKGGAA